MTELQKTILDIFKEVALLCEKEHIDYYALGGTAIGAVWHSGFIPWDDDMDIMIPVEDFDRFIGAAERNLPDYLKIYTYKDSVRYGNIFIKVVDVRTTLIESVEVDYPLMYKGVFLDIMPLGGIPDNCIKRLLFYTRLYVYISCNVVHRAKEYSTVLSRFLYGFLYPFHIKRKNNIHYYMDRWKALIAENPCGSCRRVGYVWSRKVIKWNFPRAFFAEGKEFSFEDTVIQCPKEWDECLKAEFGNYMELPEEKERIPSHTYFVDLHTSYEFYRKHPEMVSDKKGMRNDR